MGIPILGKLPLVTSVSTCGDRGVPVIVGSFGDLNGEAKSSHDIRGVISDIAKNVWANLENL